MVNDCAKLCGKFGSIPTFRSTRKGKTEMFFVMSLHLSDHKVLHNTASSSSFFLFRSDFLAFFHSYFVLQIFGFKEFNKTITPFALVGYETGYSQLGATHLVGYLPSHIQRVLMEKLLIIFIQMFLVKNSYEH